jgi:hypothetical protein
MEGIVSLGNFNIYRKRLYQLGKNPEEIFTRPFSAHGPSRGNCFPELKQLGQRAVTSEE